MMNAEENYYLRPEAQAFDYDQLTDSQKSALKEILTKLDDAQKNIRVEQKANQRKSGHDHGIYVPIKNHNKCLLLAGMRGSGKTSLLYSLIKFLSSKENHKEESNTKTAEEINDNYKHLRNNVLWLSPLEMETLPPATNLLAAILTRVDEAINRFEGWHPKVHQAAFNLCQEERDILLEFNRLQQDVALSWNGNLEKRSATIDTDVYAIEVLRAEQYRVKVIERIQECVEKLYTNFIGNYSGNSDHLFVLPVDDFDLNPQRCLDLVRMIRMYNVPRLVTLILCDQRVIHQLLNLKYFESIVRLESNPGASLGGMSFEEYGPSFELSSSAIKKLFPWSHKVLLDKMSAKEVFDFHPNKNDSDKNTIKKYLDKYIIGEINSGCCIVNQNKSAKPEGTDIKGFLIAKKEIKSISDFFDMKVNDHIANIKISDDSYFYIGKFLFKLSPRNANDLWLAVDKFRNNPQDLRFAANFFKEKISQGRNITLGLSLFIGAMLKKDFADQYQLDTSALHLIYTYSQSIQVARSGQSTFQVIAYPKNWHLEVDYPHGNMNNTPLNGRILLDDLAAAGVIFLHDLLAFRSPYQVTGNRLMEDSERIRWAYTQWPLGCRDRPIIIPWRFPPWLTLFECDILRRCWAEVWRYVNANMKPSNAKELPCFLAYAWLRIITSMFAKDNTEDKFLFSFPKGKEKFKVEGMEKGWKDLSDDLNALAEEIDQHVADQLRSAHRGHLISEWFAAIGCLLAPETDLPEDIVDIINGFKESGDFKEIFLQPSVCNRIRELRTQSAVLFFDNYALDELVNLFNPVPKSKWCLWPDSAESDGEDMHWINQINDHLLCPYWEDIVMQSTLEDASKDKLMDRLIKMMASNECVSRHP